MSDVFYEKLARIVEANLEKEPFGVNELVKEVGLSRSQIHRKLKSITGQSISQFIREIRLRRAHELLEGQSGNVSEIGYQVGFSSPTYFNKCFQDYFGYPPGSVKKLELRPSKIKRPNSKKFFTIALLFGVGALLAIALMYLNSWKTATSQAQDRAESSLLPVSTEKSIAVLPFKNISNDPDQEALCDGLTEEIIYHLSQIKSFDKVISHSSVMSLKNSDKTLPEKAALLKVNIVLEGSFRQSGDRIKITAQLIDAINDNHLWSEIYERPFGDIFDIQSDIAKNIAAKFKAEITREEEARLDKQPTESSEAYSLLKKGRATTMGTFFRQTISVEYDSPVGL